MLKVSSKVLPERLTLSTRMRCIFFQLCYWKYNNRKTKHKTIYINKKTVAEIFKSDIRFSLPFLWFVITLVSLMYLRRRWHSSIFQRSDLTWPCAPSASSFPSSASFQAFCKCRKYIYFISHIFLYISLMIKSHCFHIVSDALMKIPNTIWLRYTRSYGQYLTRGKREYYMGHTGRRAERKDCVHISHRVAQEPLGSVHSYEAGIGQQGKAGEGRVYGRRHIKELYPHVRRRRKPCDLRVSTGLKNKGVRLFNLFGRCNGCAGVRGHDRGYLRSQCFVWCFFSFFSFFFYSLETFWYKLPWLLQVLLAQCPKLRSYTLLKTISKSMVFCVFMWTHILRGSSEVEYPLHK